MTPPLDLPQDSTPLWGEVEAGEPDSLDADGVDVVIVGAGLVGLTTALSLAERGVRPLVLEAVRPGFGTTGGSTAKVTLLQGALADRIGIQHAFVVPLVCYVYIIWYGLRGSRLQAGAVPATETAAPRPPALH